MSAILSIFGAFALIVFIKFIYDTFLTTNTSRNWAKYQSAFPHEAAVIENNNGLNFKTDFKPKTNGYYTCNLSGRSPEGFPFQLTEMFIFNDLGYVVRFEMEGEPVALNREQGVVLLRELQGISEASEECAKFKWNDGKISIRFDEGSLYGEEFVGSVLQNGLLLTRLLHNYNEILERPTTKTTLVDMRFTFHEVFR
jgi:hypothetical protein